MPLTTTFRTDVCDGLLACLNAVVAANPTLLKRAYRARPSNITPDLPAAFIADRSESGFHDSQLRNRTMSVSVVVVREYSDNMEDAAAFDALVDILLEAFTAVPQLAVGTMWDKYTWADEEYQIGDYLYPAVRFTFQNITDMKGRV